MVSQAKYQTWIKSRPVPNETNIGYRKPLYICSRFHKRICRRRPAATARIFVVTIGTSRLNVETQINAMSLAVSVTLGARLLSWWYIYEWVCFLFNVMIKTRVRVILITNNYIISVFPFYTENYYDSLRDWVEWIMYSRYRAVFSTQRPIIQGEAVLSNYFTLYLRAHLLLFFYTWLFVNKLLVNRIGDGSFQ